MTAIHLAQFGNRSGEHALLADTGTDRGLLRNAAWRTDVPPQGDVETVGSFYSGYLLGDTYVVQHTRPDTMASRPGMVATAAAFVPTAVVADIALGPLLRHLRGLGDDLPEPLDVALFHPKAECHAHPNGASALASALLAHRRAVWYGDGLADAMACLWYHLRPEERTQLAFGAAFHPDVLSIPVADGGLLVLTIPERTLPRWEGWPAVSAESPPRTDTARDAFFGDGDPAPLVLAELLAGGAIRTNQWKHLVTVADLAQHLGELDHRALRSLLQLLGLLTGTRQAGEALKKGALARLENLTPQAPFGDIRGLRTLPWTLLPEPDVQTFIRSWVRTIGGDSARAAEAADAIAEILNGPADEFRDTLANEVRDTVRDAARPVQLAIAVRLLGNGSLTTVDWLAGAAGSREHVDELLAHAIASLGQTEDDVSELARRRRLPRTHAATVDITDPVTAWTQHLAIRARSLAADELLARRGGPEATVRAALSIDDETLTALAAHAAASRPALLRPVKIADTRYRAVWAAAVRQGVDPWACVRPQDAATPLLDVLVADDSVDDTLLDALSRTSAASIVDYPKRASVWTRLPNGPLTRMLTATAETVARQLRPFDPSPESPLTAAILAPQLLGAIAHDDPEQAVHLLNMLPAADEHAVTVAHRGHFDQAAADALGRAIAERRWKRAAERIVDLAATRPDLRPTASRVSGLFSVLERVRRFMGMSDGVDTIASQGELRDALHDIAARLYPSGPADRSLWERAGGSPADCPDGSTGRHRWGLAIAAVEEGNAGAPSRATLLQTMLGDHPHNADLATLAATVPAKDDR